MEERQILSTNKDWNNQTRNPLIPLPESKGGMPLLPAYEAKHYQNIHKDAHHRIQHEGFKDIQDIDSYLENLGK